MLTGNTVLYCTLGIIWYTRKMLKKAGLGICSFALVALLNGATVSELLYSLFKKEWTWANCYCRSLMALVALHKRATGVICSWFERISQKTSNSLEQIHIFRMFLTVFHCFSPFLCSRANRSRRSCRSFAHKTRDLLEKPRANSQPCKKVSLRYIMKKSTDTC